MGIREEGLGEGVSGGVVSVHGGKGQIHRGESDVVEGGDVGIVAEMESHALSPGKGVYAFFVHKISKSMSPSKLGGNGGENNAHGSQVCPTKSFHIWSILESYNPTKLLIFDFHGTILDTSVLTQPNPNPNILVMKKKQ